MNEYPINPILETIAQRVADLVARRIIELLSPEPLLPREQPTALGSLMTSPASPSEPDLRHPIDDLESEPESVSTAEAAKILNMAESRLYTLRKEGRGPKFFTVPAGARLYARYPVATLKEWRENRENRESKNGSA